MEIFVTLMGKHVKIKLYRGFYFVFITSTLFCKNMPLIILLTCDFKWLYIDADKYI